MIEFKNERIENLRASMNMSRRQFARHTGIARQSLIQYEQGDCEPTIASLLKMCNTCNEHPNYFFASGDVHIHSTGVKQCG